MHILLVDDDAELCSLLGEFLRREGFTVDCEHEGNRGLEKARGAGVDLVVLDVMLPGIDGFEILRRIRHAPRETAVEVSLARNNGKAVVGVRDQGSDVPEEALARLFEGFYRVEGDHDRASGGTGLGMSIARRAMELHRGSIGARNSRPGLEVEMELPVA